MPRREKIITILEDRFSPQHLEVRDVSHQHHGHGGWREEGETHFEVDIKAEALSAVSRIDAHRAVNDALADELASGLHALQITVLR